VGSAPRGDARSNSGCASFHDEAAAADDDAKLSGSARSKAIEGTMCAGPFAPRLSRSRWLACSLLALGAACGRYELPAEGMDELTDPGVAPQQPAHPGTSNPGSSGGATPGLAPGKPGQSCVELPETCGSGESCCAVELVPAGVFTLGVGEFAESTASVSSFYLDKYEVTVARFQRFLASYDVWRAAGYPAAGQGERSRNDQRGWKERWNQALLPTADAVREAAASCWDMPYSTLGSADENPTLPMNCVTWFEAFAFCVWDGGLLPSEVEWEYAATGGDEQRPYPWGFEMPTSRLAVHACGLDDLTCSPDELPSVGSKPAGAGRWGHLDLAGSMAEWIFDSGDVYEESCVDCVEVESELVRMVRGGDWGSAPELLTTTRRYGGDPAYRNMFVGFRCARHRAPDDDARSPE